MGEEWKRVTVFDIKLVAIASMVIDHLGVFFFPGVTWLRVVGRAAFPLFAWLVANGARHTRDGWAYLVRLAAAAVVSQPIFILAQRLVDPTYGKLNVLFTLALGLAAIGIMRKSGGRWGKALVLVGMCLVAEVGRVEYGAVGILAVVVSDLFFDRWALLVYWQGLVFAAPFILAGVLAVISRGTAEVGISGYYQMLAPLAFILVYFYNGRQGPKMKYLFYVFYPGQFVVFYLLKRAGF